MSYRALLGVVAVSLLGSVAVAQSNTEVLFQVNTNLLQTFGEFDPAADPIYVRGAITGWECSPPMVDDDGDGVFELTVQAEALAAGTYAYKYNIGCADEGWEPIGDRVYEVTGTESDDDGNGFLNVVAGESFFGNVEPGNADVEVTFRVDMSVQTEQGLFDPGLNSVVVRGAINGWGCSEALVESEVDGVYTIQLEQLAAPVGLQAFKFNRDCSDDGWEDLSDRLYKVKGNEGDADGDGLLEVDAGTFFFDDLAAEAGFADIELVFRVDMSVQIGQGNFEPGVDTIQFRGEANDWGCSEMTDDDGDEVYEYRVTQQSVADGSTTEYKLNINCNDGGWEDRDNRKYTVDTTLADSDGDGFIEQFVQSFFNDQEVALVVQDIDVTFNLDMSVQIDREAFNPGLDFVVVRGEINGWGCTELEDPDGDGTYSVTLPSDAAFEGMQEYKFNVNCLDSGWESRDNRMFEVAAGLPDDDGNGRGDITVADYFNDLTEDDVVQENLEVIFSVDLTAVMTALDRGVTISAGGQTLRFSEEITGVGVTGPWFGETPWNWNSFTGENMLFDDGSGFDRIPGDNVYTGTVLITPGTAKDIIYKYGLVTDSASGIDNEAGFAQNHTTRLRDTDDEFFNGTDCFGSQNQDPTIRLGGVPGGFDCTRSVGPFLRGDCDQTGTVDLTSGVFLLNYLFQGGVGPKCLAACDASGRGRLDISTAVFVFNWLFLGGGAPPQPVPTDDECGYSADPRDLLLGCEDPIACSS